MDEIVSRLGNRVEWLRRDDEELQQEQQRDNEALLRLEQDVKRMDDKKTSLEQKLSVSDSLRSSIHRLILFRILSGRCGRWNARETWH